MGVRPEMDGIVKMRLRLRVRTADCGSRAGHESKERSRSVGRSAISDGCCKDVHYVVRM